jgi:hypothetical protein
VARALAGSRAAGDGQALEAFFTALRCAPFLTPTGSTP